MTNKRVVIVTGGAYGIGRAIVQRFASEGEAVIIADQHRERGRELQAQLANNGSSVVFYEIDLRDPAQIAELTEFTVKKWDRIDVLCNNAGIEINHRADEYSLEDWSALLDTNLRAAFLASKHAFPHLKERSGSIINIASVQGIACERETSVYATTKAGLMALTRGTAIDFAPHGVRVNAICPGAILTGMMEKYLRMQTNSEAALEELAKNIPLKRIGKPEEIAGLVYFLASKDASYITGASFIADGGLLARLGT